MPVHRDLRNAKGFDVLVRAVGDFVGGGLWVESEDGTGPVLRRFLLVSFAQDWCMTLRIIQLCFLGIDGMLLNCGPGNLGGLSLLSSLGM